MRWCDPSLVKNTSGKDTGAKISISVHDADGKSVGSYTMYNGQAVTIKKGHKQPYTISLTSTRTGINSFGFKADDAAELFIVPCESLDDTRKLAYYIYGTQGPNGENSTDHKIIYKQLRGIAIQIGLSIKLPIKSIYRQQQMQIVFIAPIQRMAI